MDRFVRGNNDVPPRMRSFLVGGAPGRGRAMIRVLLVDDNARFRQAFVRLLEWHPDIEVVAQAGSLAEAQDKLSGIEVAALDRGLPDGDGLDLIGELREANPEAVVLVLSATLEPTLAEQAYNAGAEGVIDKMASPEEIVGAIRRAAGD
jgi:DNA-binding NarL/FixJ family response regulator